MQIPAKLKYVNIFFDTPTFDKITKDKSAKVNDCVDQKNVVMNYFFSLLTCCLLLEEPWDFSLDSQSLVV